MSQLLGRALSGVRAGADRSPLSSPAFDVPDTLNITSPAFTDGSAIPARHAGEGVGENISPALAWTGLPAQTRQLLLIIDDIDAPLPRPVLHAVALLPPDRSGLGEGELVPTTPGVRMIRTTFSRHGYAGPRPVPGHGPHRYRFQLFALEHAVPDTLRTARALFAAVAGHVLARGTTTGIYQR
jgi:phosphatidylethanolamine-binding protein (PEBP) family uncharacterized protein